MSISLVWRCAIPLAFLSGACALSAQVLVNDPLNNTDRATQNLPTEAAWFKGGGSNVTLTATSTGMQFTRSDAGTSRLLATNFVDSTAGRTLVVGETLTMDYTFSASAVGTGTGVAQDNRMGLFSFANPASTRLTADNSSANGPDLTNVPGYVFTFQISDSLLAAPFTISKVTPNGSNTNLSKGATFSALTGATTLVAGTGHGLTSGAEYTLRLELSLVSATQMDITVSYLDLNDHVLASVMASDTASVNTTFDAFMYRAATQAGFGGTQTITNFRLGVSSPVPEPSTYAMMSGAAVLGLAVWRRRVRMAKL